MGQYYKPCLINEDNEVVAWLYSHNYSNGLKLMEHSWLGNNFVEAVESLIIENGRFHPKENNVSLVWAGDYAEPEEGVNQNLYQLCHDQEKINPVAGNLSKFNYIVNHDKKQFVDKRKVEVEDSMKQWGDYRIHPLPLLTAEGNGQGGGDFRGEDPRGLVGSWARNRISIEKRKPRGYEELVFDLTES